MTAAAGRPLWAKMQRPDRLSSIGPLYADPPLRIADAPRRDPRGSPVASLAFGNAALEDEPPDLVVFRRIGGLQVEGADEPDHEHGQADPHDVVGESQAAAHEVHSPN